jgi:hypothetical protein
MVVSQVGISSKESAEFRQWKLEQQRLTQYNKHSFAKESAVKSKRVVRFSSPEARKELIAKKKISAGVISWQSIDVKESRVLGKMCYGIKVYDYKSKDFYTKYYNGLTTLSEALKDVNVAKIQCDTLTTPEFLVECR